MTLIVELLVKVSFAIKDNHYVIFSHLALQLTHIMVRKVCLALLEAGAYEPADYSIPQEDRLIELLLEELIDYLEEFHPGYGSVFHLLCDGLTNRREIGETLGVPTGTIKDWVPKIRRLAEEYYNRY